MKSEERHRLQETELEKLGRRARDFWETFSKYYGKTVFIGIGVASILAVIAAWWYISSESAQAQRWKDVITASFDPNPSQSLIQLERAAGLHSDYPAGQWAALMEAERALREGIRMTREDRPASIDELTRARESFTQLATSESELIQERRAFGMARCLEALAGVDLTRSGEGESDNETGPNVTVEEARLAYEKFVEDYGQQGEEAGPTSIFLSLAEERVEALQTQRVQTFYAMYRELNPTPEDRETPEDGGTPTSPTTPGGMPSGHPPVSPGSGPGSTPPGLPSETTPLDIPDGPSFPEGPSSPTDDQSQEASMKELETLVEEAEKQAQGGQSTDNSENNEPSKPGEDNSPNPSEPNPTPPESNLDEPAEPAGDSAESGDETSGPAAAEKSGSDSQ